MEGVKEKYLKNPIITIRIRIVFIFILLLKDWLMNKNYCWSIQILRQLSNAINILKFMKLFIIHCSAHLTPTLSTFKTSLILNITCLSLYTSYSAIHNLSHPCIGACPCRNKMEIVIQPKHCYGAIILTSVKDKMSKQNKPFVVSDSRKILP